jgi:hypothetical protein
MTALVETDIVVRLPVRAISFLLKLEQGLPQINNLADYAS